MPTAKKKRKPLSLADRIAQQNRENTPQDEIQREQHLVSVVSNKAGHQDTSRSTQGQVSVKSESSIKSESSNDQVSSIKQVSSNGRDSIDTVSTQDQHRDDIVSTKDPVSDKQISSIKQVSTEDQVSSIDQVSNKGQGQVSSRGQVSGINIHPNGITIAPLQQKVYEWFLHNGLNGYFNKGDISRGTGITPPTVRKAVDRLRVLSLIKIGEWDPVSRKQTYEINTAVKVCLLSGSSQGQVSSQGQYPVSSTKQVSSIEQVSTQGQVSGKSGSTSNNSKLVSLKKLTDYLNHSVFWKEQGVTINKCHEWLKEFYPDDPEALLQQLMFAEKTESVLNPKTKTSVHVFYGCLKNGGLTRPKDFEFPHERALRIKRQEIEIQEKKLAELESIRKQEREIADKMAFELFVGDPENVEILISEIEKSTYLTPKAKASIQAYRDTKKIDSRLEIALQREFEKSDE